MPKQTKKSGKGSMFGGGGGQFVNPGQTRTNPVKKG